jgi:hypothetical protein
MRLHTVLFPTRMAVNSHRLISLWLVDDGIHLYTWSRVNFMDWHRWTFKGKLLGSGCDDIVLEEVDQRFKGSLERLHPIQL